LAHSPSFFLKSEVPPFLFFFFFFLKRLRSPSFFQAAAIDFFFFSHMQQASLSDAALLLPGPPPPFLRTVWQFFFFSPLFQQGCRAEWLGRAFFRSHVHSRPCAFSTTGIPVDNVIRSAGNPLLTEDFNGLSEIGPLLTTLSPFPPYHPE